MLMCNCPICGGEARLKYSDIFDDRFGCPSMVSINACDNCGHKFVEPQLNDGELSSLYEEHYGRTTTTVLTPSPTVHRPFRRWLLGHHNLGQFVLDSDHKHFLLDVGSGDCQNLLDAVHLGFHGVGFDVDPTSAQIGEQHGLDVRNASSVSSAFTGVEFDAIQLNQVIEHYPNPRLEIGNLRNHIKRDGILFISTPNAGSIFRRVFGRRWINWHVPYHQHHFTKRSLKILLEQEGWRIVSMKTVTPMVWFVLQIRRAITRPVCGTPTNGWNGEQNRFVSALLLALPALLLLPIRALDFLRQGDSLVLVAVPKK